MTSDDKNATRPEPFWFLPFSCLEDDSFETISENQPTFESAVESENGGEFCHLFVIHFRCKNGEGRWCFDVHLRHM